MLTKNFQQLKSEVASHIAADAVAQGSYTTCFIGCLANHSNDPEHIENTYGIPKMVTRIAESIFEGLPEDEAPAFFAALPDAVGCDGKDLSRVPWQFLAKELKLLPAVGDEIHALIDRVIAGMNLLAEGKEWPEAKAAQAAAMAASAAASAASAAEAAVAARAVAWAASAANAASAAWAASAASAAAVRRRQRDLLLRLIKEAPVVSAEGE